MKSRQFAHDVGISIDVLGHDNGFYDIRVSAWNGAFGGVAIIYLDIGGLEAISKKIAGFPKDPRDAREIMLGSFGRKFAGGAASMRFYCADRAGHAYVESKIESAEESAGVLQSAVISMPIEAASMDVFVEELRRMERARSGCAHLKGMG